LITCVPIHSFRGSPPKSNNEGEALLKKDRQTSLEVFGGYYVHTYKFNEAVDDEVVLDLVYEARDAKQIFSPSVWRYAIC
jgi:type I site-specific restriction-modification system R (restriction) subunit